MNRIIPYSKLFWAGDVWSPKNVPSRETSRHQQIMVNKIMIVESASAGVMLIWNQ